MWIEQYIDCPILSSDAGYAEEEQFLRCCAYVTADQPPEDSRTIFPVRTMPDGGQYLLNTYEQHVLIAGCTGSGKSRRVLIPAILNAMASKDSPSMFIWDVKGELHALTEAFAKKRGYEVVCIDLINPGNSSGYSLTEPALSRFISGDLDGCEKALADLASAISPLPGKNSTMDPFWSRVAQNAFMGVALYLLETDLRHFNFPAVAAKLMDVFADEEIARKFVNMVERKCGSDSCAFRHIKTALSGSDKTLQNVCTTILADLSEFMKSTALVSILKKPTPKVLENPIRKPTVIYFKTSEASEALYRFGQVVFTQLYQRLNMLAGSGKLSRRFFFFLDEVCNGQRIPDLERMLALCRSKNICISLVLQSLKQLESVYAENADTIRSNCGTFIVLRTTDPDTWERVSNLAGVDLRGCKLIQPNQLAHLPIGRALYLTPDSLPYMAQIEDFTRLPWLKD